MSNGPGVELFTQRSPRVSAARKLLRRKERDEQGQFLAEGPQAVREALAVGGATELFATPDAAARYPSLVGGDLPVWLVTEAGLASLSETVTPQGLVAVCGFRHLAAVGSSAPILAVVLAGIADPGNAGTVLRTADAAGAGTVVFPDGTVDPYNGKCVRAGAGSLFHLDVVRGGSAVAAVQALRDNGLRILAADAHGAVDLDEYADSGGLASPTAWIFGSEAHGIEPEVAALADAAVTVPVYGRAESLNLAAAAAVCLYASARALRPLRGAS
jgi:TrmH family RNA methyltransferase